MILTPFSSYNGVGKVCIAFRYKTTFNDSRVIVTEYDVDGSRSRIAWDQSPSMSSSWRTAIFEIRLVGQITQRIRIYPHYDVMRYFGGSFSVKDVKVVSSCGEGYTRASFYLRQNSFDRFSIASNCSLGYGSFCGWETGPKPSVSFYVRREFRFN